VLVEFLFVGIDVDPECLHIAKARVAQFDSRQLTSE